MPASPVTKGDGFGHAAQQKIILQTDSNITSLAVVDDMVLVAGLEGGELQAFNLHDNGSQLFHLHHHEGKVTIIRSLQKITDDHPETEDLSNHNIVVGSEDATMSIVGLDGEVVRTIRHHTHPIVDIAASNAWENGVIVSADRSGVVIVWRIDMERIAQRGEVLWTSTFPGLRSVSLSTCGSWLVCCRHQNSPIAWPVAEWVRQGTGQFHQRPISSLHITADERFLLTGGEDGLVFVWDLNNNLKFLMRFQQHLRGTPVTIRSITTALDSERVASSDSSKFIFLWRRDNGSVIRMLDRGSGGMARFLPNDFLLLQTNRGLKVLDQNGVFFASTAQTFGSCSDIYVATDQDFQSCLLPDMLEDKPAAASFRQNHSSSSDSHGSSSYSESIAAPNEDEQPIPRTAAPPAVDYLNLDEREKFRYKCFIGVTKENPDNGQFMVSIFPLTNLEAPRYCLLGGDVEDEFGDEEYVAHSDRITTFVFLPPRPAASGPSPDRDAVPPPPTLFLAATGGEDLTVIVWNWRKQIPLATLSHTHFVTQCLFMYAPLLSTAYTSADVEYLKVRDPSYRQLYNGANICYLVTSQYADTNNQVTLRLFDIKELPRAHQRRLVELRCGVVATAATFPFHQIEVTPSATMVAPHSSGSVRCLAVRWSDGLLCSGHDQTCEVIFWRYGGNDIRFEKEMEYNDDSDAEEDERAVVRMKSKTFGLRPLRRIVSRI